MFYPLLDDARLIGIVENLMGEDFILVATEGIIHTGGSPWHHDACAPEGLFSMRAAIYLDPLGPNDGCLSVLFKAKEAPLAVVTSVSTSRLTLA